MDKELGPLPTSIGKPVVVLEIINMLRNKALELRRSSMTGWDAIATYAAYAEAQVFEDAAKMVEERFYK